MSKSPPYANRPLQFSLLTLLAVMLVAGLLFGVIGSGIRRKHRERLRRQNLKEIALAFHNYHDTYQCFPPAYVPDEDGKPMHSWRVLVLEFMRDPTAKQVYKQYDFSQPWNSPRNLASASQIPSVYRSPFRRDSKLTTNYMVITGPGTIFEAGKRRSFRHVLDGTSNTLLAVEVVNSNITWTEPKDLDYGVMPLSINASQNGDCISSDHPDGAFVALADGSVRLLPKDLSPGVLRLLIERADLQVVPEIPE
jgi:hypothetical protein